MTDKEKVKRIRQELGLGQVEFAALLSMKQGSISDIERGKTSEMSEKLKDQFIKMGVNPNFIDSGAKPVFISKPSIGVPILNTDFTAGDVNQFDDVPNKVIGFVDLDNFRRCKWIVPVKGASMEPVFKTGDFVGLEPMQNFSIIEYGQPFAITTKDGQRFIKIIRKGRDIDHLILRSYNPDYDDIEVHRNDVLKVYKVHGPIRNQWQ